MAAASEVLGTEFKLRWQLHLVVNHCYWTLSIVLTNELLRGSTNYKSISRRYYSTVTNN